MNIKYTPVNELFGAEREIKLTDVTRLKGVITGEPQRSWPFKLTGTNGEEIYLKVYEGEIRAVLKQMSDIVGELP